MPPGTPAPGTFALPPPNGFTTPLGTPAPATPAPKAAAPEPVGFTMHFHMGGNFDASLEMNVTQGQAKEKVSVAKKRKSDAATKPVPYLQPMTPGTALPPQSSNPTPHGTVAY